MIPKVALMLVAATAVAGRITHGPNSHPHQMVLMPALSRGCPSALEPAPLICKFLQPDLEFQYKPQLIAPSTYIPPLIVEKCDEPGMDIEIPAMKKPIVIPEAPVLPPITIPKFPVPVMIEKPLPAPVPVAEPCEPTFVKEIPAKMISLVPEHKIITIPEVHEMPHRPMIVPQPPVLPEFVMPDLPVRVEIPMAQPCPEDLPAVASVLEYIPPAPMPLPVVDPGYVKEEDLTNIPEAPELPPFHMPALPAIVLPEPVIPEIPQLVVPHHPALPAIEMPELPVREKLPMAEPCYEDQPIPAPVPGFISYEPAFMPEIPMVPALPPFEMPALPKNEAISEPVVPFYQAIAVPQPPQLPAFVMPELPVRIEAQMPEPCLEDQPIPTPEYIPPPLPVVESFKPAFVPEIPMAPALPPFQMPVFPEIEVKPTPPVASYQAMEVPQAPELPAFVMPELPIRIETPSPEPCLEDQPIPIAPMPEYIPLPVPMPLPVAESFKPIVVPEIPKAPVLPPFEMPALPEIVTIPEGQVAPLPELPAPIMPEYPMAQPIMIAPCPEDLPVVSIPEYSNYPLLPKPVPELPKAPMPVIPFPYQPMIKPDPCLFGEVALSTPEPPKPSEPIVSMIPCETHEPVKMADIPYFVRYPSYIPAVHGDFYNHLPKTSQYNMRYVL